MIPAVLRESYLQRLHEGHLSADKVESNAKQHMFWPGMRADIKDYTRRCQVCIKRNRPAREPLQPHEIPNGPWQKLGMDFFDFKGKCFILICDYFSKFPFMFSCKTSWGSLKDRLIDLFSNEGYFRQWLAFQQPRICRLSLQPWCQTYNIITTLSPEQWLHRAPGPDGKEPPLQSSGCWNSVLSGSSL